MLLQNMKCLPRIFSNLKIKQALYIGERNGIHDRRFIEILEQKCIVSKHFVSENGTDSDIDFENLDFIVAAPLTEPISKIPNNTSIPIIGISLAYDVNESSDSDSLRKNIQKCDLIICDCEYVRKRICNEYNYPIERTIVIPFGCDLETYKWNGARDFQKPRFLITRNWTKLHSNVLILEALQILSSARVDFTCIFLGDGPELENAKNLIHNSPLKSVIEFRGNTSSMEMARLMQESNIYISASSSDGSSVSLMEAMVNGLVCLVSDFPSNLEWISDKESGFLFSNGSSGSLAEALFGILKRSPAELNNIARMGQEIAEKRADWNKNKAIFLESILTSSKVNK
jgi:glycosyltransferase involved in cell wall biosynthesis